ncbi:MAG: WGR domain-containing protein [Leptospiraceae bacterium]|nr:WGR domain-containing protein [Leptospiraceae bacterium]
MKRYFEYCDEKSSKFWEIEFTKENEYQIRFGKTGSEGTTQIKSFDSKKNRDTEANKLINTKIKKGYQETKDRLKKASQAKKDLIKETHKPEKVFKTVSAFLKSINKLLVEFQVGDFDLNYEHYCEMGVSDFCVTSGYWLCSISNTGHDHIGIMPVLNRPVNQWPVGYLDQNEGTLSTFASSVKTWLPGYLIAESQKGWHFQENFEENRDEIIKILKPFLAKRSREFVDLLIANSSTSKLYEIVEPGSFLHEYHILLEKEKFSLNEWKKYLKKYPFFNEPLLHILNLDKADKVIYEKLLNCILRHDLGSYSFKLLKMNAKKMCTLFSENETPLYPLLLNFKNNKKKYIPMADAFFEAGKYYQKLKQYWKAYCCFDNSIWAERCETEEFREDAYIEQIKVAKLLNDEVFYSQYEGACLPEKLKSDNNDESSTTLKELIESFKEHRVPEPLAKLAVFWDDLGTYFCDEFELQADKYDMAKAWFKENKKGYSKIIPFGVDGTGALFAFWLYKSGITTENAPVVYLGSEGIGNTVLAENILDFMQILTANRAYIPYDKAFFEYNDEYKTENNKYRKWLKKEFGLEVIKNPTEKWKQAVAKFPSFEQWITTILK